MSTELTEEQQTAQHYFKNSLLLEADIEEEIQSLLEEVDRKQKTSDNILTLPNKISHDCMVPICKVAFSPGRLIHTNEFSVQIDAKSGERQWMSHVEASRFLLCEITRIQGDIAQLQTYLEARRQESGTGARKKEAQAVVSKSSVQRTSTVGGSGDAETTITKQAATRAKEEYIPFAEEIPLSGDSEDEDEDAQWASAGGPAGQGFEIREYCDEDGRVLDGQIVDLSKELSQLQTEQQQQVAAAAQRQGASSPSSSDDAVPRGGENLVDEINEKLNVPQAGSAELDQDAIFVRELAQIASSKQKKARGQGGAGRGGQGQERGDLDSFFAELERQEEEARSSQQAASKGQLSSSQWKKGFFSSSTPQKKPKQQQQQQQSTSLAAGTKGPAPAARESTSHKPGGSAPVPGATTVAAATERNTLLNSSRSPVDLGGAVGRRGEMIEDSEGAPAPAPAPAPAAAPKKVSRFKQNRATVSAVQGAPGPPTPGEKPVPFSGHVVEK